MTTTPRNPGATRTRLALVAAVTAIVAIGSACTLELDDDRAAARRIAERVERSIERHADDGNSVDLDAVTDAVDIVFGAAILDDIADENDLAVDGLFDVDGDRHDDDGRFEISVADAAACLEFTGDRVTFTVEPCES